MPHRVGPYELEHVIGTGALGVTHLARDTRTDCSAALKLVTPEISRDPEVAARLQHEIRVASQLDHPNIARISEQGVDDGVHYIVTDYAPGETLRARMERDGRLSELETHGVAICVAHALNAASALRVTHRDLTPENILLGEDGQLRVCDFSLTRALDAATPTRTIAFVASPAYAAPELSDRRGDTQSDLYSLGVIMFEALAGHLPLDDATDGVRKRGGPSPDRMLLRRVAPALAGIVQRLLEPRPDARYSTPEELIDALQSVTRLERAVVEVAPAPAAPVVPAAASVPAIPTAKPLSTNVSRPPSKADTASAASEKTEAPRGRRFSLFGNKAEKQLTEYADRVLVDETISEADEKSFMEFAASLGITSLRKHPALRDRLIIARANDGRLPTLSEPPHVYCEPGETVHFEAKAALLDDGVVTSWRGMGVDFLPSRGAKYHLVADLRAVIAKSVTTLDSGFLSVTSRRIVFTGAKTTQNSLYPKLEFLRVYGDALGIAVSDRQNRSTYGLIDASGQVAAAVINAAVQKLSEAEMSAG